MQKNVMMRTNLFICLVIICGFLVTAIISYRSNNGIFMQDIENISTLTSEGIYHQIDSIFTKPIHISMTMANDRLLKSFLLEEKNRGMDEAFIQTMRDYLLAYREQYGYDSVFLVSTETNRYYHFEQGVDRILTEDNPENEWYYTFLKGTREYALNIDNDEAQSADNGITVFINCKIYASDGKVMGVVGVGFAVETLQQIFQEYEDSFRLRAYLINEEGMIEISTTKTGFVQTDLFQECGFEEYKEAILADKENPQSFWYSTLEKDGFLVTRYVPNLKWHLIIEKDTTMLQKQLNRQFFLNIAIVILVIGSVLLIITSIIRKYNEQIVKLTVEKVKEHQTAFQTETEKMYENIYEIDITHNKAASEATESYFKTLGVPAQMPFDEALKIIAQKQIKEEYRDGYMKLFSTANVLKAYAEGEESLRYDFQITTNGGRTFYWMRITARIFYWKEDQSVRMLVYHQDIDNEKQHEVWMAEKMQRDSLTGLFHKAASQELIQKYLLEKNDKINVFFIIDIDNFKIVNDTCGHMVGDLVIADFGRKLQKQFRESDIVGRIGGDEFIVFVPAASKEWAEKKAGALAQELQYEFTDGEKSCQISASVGVAVAPEAGRDFEALYKNADSALYRTKARGKKGYTIYQPL